MLHFTILTQTEQSTHVRDRKIRLGLSYTIHLCGQGLHFLSPLVDVIYHWFYAYDVEWELFSEADLLYAAVMAQRLAHIRHGNT